MPADYSFTILVVDDEPPICDLLTRTARSLFPEARFINTRSAQETLTMLDQQSLSSPDLVILDIDLHQAIDGLTLLPQLSNRFKGQVPIVMLTTSSELVTRQEAKDQGAAEYTLKPDSLQAWKDYVRWLRNTWYK